MNNFRTMFLTNGVQKLENINIMKFSIHIYTTKYITGKKRIIPSALGKVYDMTCSLIPISYFRNSEYVFKEQNSRSLKTTISFTLRILENRATLKRFLHSSTFFKSNKIQRKAQEIDFTMYIKHKKKNVFVNKMI